MPRFKPRLDVEAFEYGHDELPKHCHVRREPDGDFVHVFEGYFSKVKEGDFIVWNGGRWKVMPAMDFNRTYVALAA